jgi:hypothetical protein
MHVDIRNLVSSDHDLTYLLAEILGHWVSGSNINIGIVRLQVQLTNQRTFTKKSNNY